MILYGGAGLCVFASSSSKEQKDANKGARTRQQHWYWYGRCNFVLCCIPMIFLCSLFQGKSSVQQARAATIQRGLLNACVVHSGPAMTTVECPSPSPTCIQCLLAVLCLEHVQSINYMDFKNKFNNIANHWL